MGLDNFRAYKKGVAVSVRGRNCPALVVEALRGLVGRIDAASMRAMNLAVDRDGRAPADVAAAFAEGLSPGP